MGVKQCDVKGCKEPAKCNFKNLRPTKCLEHMLVGMIWTFSKKCICENRPYYGFEDDLWPTCCKLCKTDEMVNLESIKNKKNIPKCKCGSHQPLFGLPTDDVPMYCTKCPEYDKTTMVNKVSRRCECGKSTCPMFSPPGESQGKYCKQCPDYDPETMIDVRSRRCKCGKSTKPTFGLSTDKRASYCTDCPDYDESKMINLTSSACKCQKHTASFGYPGDTKASYCSRCSEYDKETMVDFSHAKCACGKFRPCFNYPGEETPLYCSQCPAYNPETMVDVANPMCVSCGKHRPTFNLPGVTRADYCMTCSTPDMINVVTRRCKCGAHGPCFNYPDEDTALYCTECPGYDPDKMVDIVNRMCVTCKSRRPTFNVPGAKRADYCKACSTPDMVDVVTPRCQCGTHAPCFNYSDKEVPEFCTQCPGFDKDMVDLANKNKQCQSPSGCTTRAYFEFEGKMYCHEHYLVHDPNYINKGVHLNQTEMLVYGKMLESFGEANVTHQAKFDWCKNKTFLPFDMLVIQLKILVEVDGPQHDPEYNGRFGSGEERHRVDQYKEQCARENGYTVVRINQPFVWKHKENPDRWLPQLVEAIRAQQPARLNFT